MTIKTISGTYGDGYTLSANYTGIIISNSSKVFSAPGTPGVNYGGAGSAGGAAGAALSLPDCGSIGTDYRTSTRPAQSRERSLHREGDVLGRFNRLTNLGSYNMKTFVSVSLASVIAFGAVTSASAFSFSPPNTKFKLNGTVFVAQHGRQVQCVANMVGVTGASGTSTAKITRAAFGGTGTCFVTAMGLPWTLRATGSGTATLSGVAIIDAGAPCGPSTAPVTVDAQGVWSIRAIDLSGGCSFLANTLATSPPITIAR